MLEQFKEIKARNVRRSKEPTPGVMIDPSLIAAERTAKRTFMLLQELAGDKGHKVDFYFPHTLIGILPTAKADIFAQVLGFFAQGARPADPGMLRELAMDAANVVKPFEVNRDSSEIHAWIAEGLRAELTDQRGHVNPAVLNILFEEWVFLNTESWIVSRTKNTFNRFIAAGSACLELGQRQFDRIVRATLHKKERDIIAKIDVLKAVAKWVAVGGPACLSSLLVETLGGWPLALISVSGGLFLLYDPPQRSRMIHDDWI